ncbi:hypothetical protein LTR64_000113 [Lithohypha guttulata]|uniref:uncharacterized protein n=1 Tax=Lithohypha guttulata TaxID=1690604 RepID=UPI002DE014DF|nr:hypothetical protein LTR51_007475 [Lithohypha guttulata]
MANIQDLPSEILQAIFYHVYHQAGRMDASAWNNRDVAFSALVKVCQSWRIMISNMRFRGVAYEWKFEVETGHFLILGEIDIRDDENWKPLNVLREREDQIESQ